MKYLLTILLLFSTIKAQNFDCLNATQICGGGNFTANPIGFGTQELDGTNRGCIASNETSSAWYVLNIATGGFLGFTINPNSDTDYDFAIWGPFPRPVTPCFNLGTPTRCSYADPYCVNPWWPIFSPDPYNTGVRLSQTAGDVSEDACTSVNGFVRRLTVTAGENYLLLINNYSNDTRNFNLSFSLGSGATLGCPNFSIFPIDEFELILTKNKGSLNFTWITNPQVNISYYLLENIGVDSSINTIYYTEAHEANKYTFNINYLPKNKLFFRVKAVDYNGNTQYSNVVEYIPTNDKPYTFNSVMTDYFSVEAMGTLNYKIYDMSARLILEGKTNETYHVDCLDKGIYLLEINGNYHKLIKQ